MAKTIEPVRVPRAQVRKARAQFLKDEGITRREFAENTAQDLGTAHRWFNSNRTPRRLYLGMILDVYPRWPYAA